MCSHRLVAATGDQHRVDAQHVPVQLAAVQEGLRVDSFLRGAHLHMREAKREAVFRGQVHPYHGAVVREDLGQMRCFHVPSEVVHVKAGAARVSHGFAPTAR